MLICANFDVMSSGVRMLSKNIGLGAVGGLALLWASATQADLSGISDYPYARFVVMDPETGDVVLGHDERVKIHPASFTKMMAAQVVFEAMADSNTNFNLQSLVTIPRMIKQIPKDVAAFSLMKSGDKVPAEKLLIGMGARSDAFSTLALAIHLGNSEVYDWHGTEHDKLFKFIDRMNVNAQKIGMTRSNFSVVTGIPYDEHYSTAKDIGLLMKDLQDNYPKSTELTFGQPSFDLSPISTSKSHTSRLLVARPNRVQWAKTGATGKAGYNLAVYYKKNGVSLIGVVMAETGRATRNRTMLNALTEGFKLQ